MPIIKKDGVDYNDPHLYSGDPHSMRDMFRAIEQKKCERCDDVSCDGCDGCDDSAFASLMIRLVIALCAMFVIIYVITLARPVNAATATLCAGMAEYIDHQGNVICAEYGKDLGRGIKSNFEVKK